MSPVPATSVNVCVAPASTSVAVSVPTTALAPAFSAMLLTESARSVGASFTSVTVMVNDFAKVRLPLSVACTRTL